jgi:hypothetical protein
MPQIVKPEVPNAGPAARLVKGRFDISDWLVFVQEHTLGVQPPLLQQVGENPGTPQGSGVMGHGSRLPDWDQFHAGDSKKQRIIVVGSLVKAAAIWGPYSLTRLLTPTSFQDPTTIHSPNRHVHQRHASMLRVCDCLRSGGL